ncbi:MAG: ABC transporter ATP-binding protein [Flavobacteriales bacterium]|nr:ABC transporter ATP-binding protein [Flavobacteriales bacterium]MCB9363342.1 ABC transporter ATP-binding protein [Flavobacteriales bacterium]
MSKDLILRVENISKQYRLGTVGTGTLADDLTRWWHLVRGKEDPFLKIGDTNKRDTKGSSDYVWSLKDINFDVYKGDVIGIIGKNGAGKSTLLKILSRVTTPTTGSIKSNGRIASLLEVGTGFHPELTGRENVFLNGAILGMTKKEITSKLDEIIEFSGCERYIDTPTKRYSSGMTVRLAFAVAAFLEPDILIVDEVLAVGDAEFQKKAIGKMKDISSGDNGRTVLFVSHNMAAVKSLCSTGILLNNGEVLCKGEIDEVLQQYQLLNVSNAIDLNNFNRKGNGLCRVTDIAIISQDDDIKKTTFKLGEKISIKLQLNNLANQAIENLRVVIGVYNLNDEGYLRFDTKTTSSIIKISEDKESYITCTLEEHLNIKPDQYSINIAIFQGDDLVDYVNNVSRFEIENYDYYNTGQSIQDSELSKVFYKHTWH